MHAGMDKFKTMMKAANEAAAGKKPSSEEMQRIVAAAPPEVVFLQLQASTVLRWTDGALTQLQELRA